MYMRWAQGSERTALPDVGFVQAAGYSGIPYFPEPRVTVDKENTPEATHLRLDAEVKGPRGRVARVAPYRRCPSKFHFASNTTRTRGSLLTAWCCTSAARRSTTARPSRL